MEQSKKSSKSRLGPCEICKANDAKYTCPACELTTCSLDCVKKHKKDFKCDGIRPRTSFVKLNQFTNLDLLSDYRLLEDISRVVDSSKRDKAITRTWSSNLQLPLKLNRLKVAVRSRGSHFILLPDEFARHKKNTTFYDWETKELFWRVQLIFLNSSELSITEKLVSEMIPLRSLIEKYINPTEELKRIANKLIAYKTAGMSSITVLLKAEGVPHSAKKFYKLDLDKSIRDNLVGKTIVEYPQFYVAINDFFTTKTPDEVFASASGKKIADKNLLLSSVGEDKGSGEGDTMESEDEIYGLKDIINDSSSSEEEDSQMDCDVLDRSYLSNYKQLVRK